MERLEMIQRNGRRLLRLVNSLLDFSRIEAGRASPQLAVTDIGTPTLGIASSFADVCRMAGIRLVTDCQPAWALADAGMWETIAANLVSNAFKYTFTGSITVRAWPTADGGVEVTVTDTGIGVPAADLPHLFERFYQAMSTAGRSAAGSGIGLELTKSLVGMHDGTITVDSTPGEGTTVTISLPPAAVRQPGLDAGARHAAPVAATPGLAIGRWYSSPTTTPTCAPTWRGCWVPAGRVITATDGRQALEMAGHLRPDLLVADVMMPELDGFALTAAIRSDPDLALLPVILLTARAGVKAAGEGLAIGADNYLVKPFSSADLVNRVAARLEARASSSRSRDPRPRMERTLPSRRSAVRRTSRTART